MVKFRIIPYLLHKDFSIVKGINFKNHRIVGDPPSTIKVFSMRQADEMIIVDLDTKFQNYNHSLVLAAVKNCNMPLTLGGGIKSLDQAKYLLDNGADKISINTILFKDPNTINKIANIYGQQSIVASVDIKFHKIKNEYSIYAEHGTKYIKKFEVDQDFKYMESLGVGEIVINSIDRDGTLSGIDRNLVINISNKTTIPLVIAGGCNSYEDIVFSYHHKLSGICCSSIFFWQGDSILSLKEKLFDLNVNVRKVL